MALRVLCAAFLSASFADAASLYNSSAMVPYSLWSSAAYCSVQQITSWSCQACKKTTKPVAVTVVQNKTLDAYGFVARLPDDSIAVVFRGSSSIRNWIANLDTVKTAYPGCAGCEVHKGFYDIVVEVSAQVMAAVDAYGGKNAPAIHLAGHSLGAAMATLAFADLSTAGYPVDANINFGCPRVGNPAWAAFYATLVQDANSSSRQSMRVQSGVDAAHRGGASVPVPRWSATLRAAVSSAVDIDQAQATPTLSPTEAASLRVFLKATHESGPLPAAVFLEAESALARLPVATLNAKPGAAAPPVNFRLIHYHDIVPHIPPESFGFAHEIEEIWLTEAQTSWTECSLATGEDHACSWGVPALEYSVEDHLTYDGVELDC